MSLINLKNYTDKEFLLNPDLCHIAIREVSEESKIKGAPAIKYEVIDIILTAGLTLGFRPKDKEQKEEFLSHFNIL